MGAQSSNLNPAVAAFLLAAALAFAAHAGPAEDGARLDAMYARLKTAPPDEARRLTREIRLEMSKSGSPAMNLLLKRGRDAMAADDTGLAIELLSALTDHAPGFSEGWHALSVAHARAGLFGPALADLQHALALDPRNFAAIYSLGALMEEVGQPDLAYEAYGRVAAINPHFDDVAEVLLRLKAQVGGADL